LFAILYNSGSFFNSIYAWLKIASRGIVEFREIKEIHRLRKVELVKFFDNRWISSEYRTIKKYLTVLKTTDLTLEAISTDLKNYNKAVTKEALRMRDIIRDKRHLIIFVYLPTIYLEGINDV